MYYSEVARAYHAVVRTYDDDVDNMIGKGCPYNTSEMCVGYNTLIHESAKGHALFRGDSAFHPTPTKCYGVSFMGSTLRNPAG
jgi:hypothetical protein